MFGLLRAGLRTSIHLLSLMPHVTVTIQHTDCAVIGYKGFLCWEQDHAPRLTAWRGGARGSRFSSPRVAPA